MLTSLLYQSDVATSLWRNKEVIATSCVHRVSVMSRMFSPITWHHSKYLMRCHKISPHFMCQLSRKSIDFYIDNEIVHLTLCDRVTRCQRIGSSLIQVMACRLIGSKQLPEPILRFFNKTEKICQSINGIALLEKLNTWQCGPQGIRAGFSLYTTLVAIFKVIHLHGRY